MYLLKGGFWWSETDLWLWIVFMWKFDENILKFLNEFDLPFCFHCISECVFYWHWFWIKIYFCFWTEHLWPWRDVFCVNLLAHKLHINVYFSCIACLWLLKVFSNCMLQMLHLKLLNFVNCLCMHFCHMTYLMSLSTVPTCTRFSRFSQQIFP